MRKLFALTLAFSLAVMLGCRSQPTTPPKPSPTKPEATKPEPTKPEATKPEPTKPEATKPAPPG